MWQQYFKEPIELYQQIHRWIRTTSVDKKTYTNIYRYWVIRKLTKGSPDSEKHWQRLGVLNQYIEDLADKALTQMPDSLYKLLIRFSVSYDRCLINWETAQSAAHG